MDCAEIHLSSHIFTNVQVWIQIKKAGGGLGEGAAPPPKQNDNTCLCSCVRWNMVFRDFVYICNIYIYKWYSRYTYIHTYIHNAQHAMPVVSQCTLNQVDIVGEPLSTSVHCPEIPLSPCFLPSFLPSVLRSFLPSFLPSPRIYFLSR